MKLPLASPSPCHNELRVKLAEIVNAVRVVEQRPKPEISSEGRAAPRLRPVVLCVIAALRMNKLREQSLRYTGDVMRVSDNHGRLSFETLSVLLARECQAYLAANGTGCRIAAGRRPLGGP